ncbi:GntR family transcriptional regulator [Alicyclobacillus macrosporangiidus]|uniref:DNA-binding transcriptional regulator YhcF, GntR family n=1 Tax=Alicyclobacillus macrosporangiidus TaxID=392015 RepID=A0A1I7HFC2_9BACL|nr:GntR family transcriptional regulator [Alicyclobacillus macrosporangiidus]SFU59423.1 DNA-binding transcriptional regulator YhcF, GntR family [Alicyclobacillus macrosporangiidus]
MTLDPPWQPPAWSLDPSRPLYEQISRLIRTELACGRLAPGTRLPPVRELAVHLRVTPNTVMRAYVELERDGLIQTFRGQGTFVSRDPSVVTASRRALAREAVSYVERIAESMGMSVEALIRLAKGEDEGGDSA